MMPLLLSALASCRWRCEELMQGDSEAVADSFDRPEGGVVFVPVFQKLVNLLRKVALHGRPFLSPSTFLAELAQSLPKKN